MITPQQRQALDNFYKLFPPFNGMSIHDITNEIVKPSCWLKIFGVESLEGSPSQEVVEILQSSPLLAMSTPDIIQETRQVFSTWN